jgi:hypothetical protein
METLVCRRRTDWLLRSHVCAGGIRVSHEVATVDRVRRGARRGCSGVVRCLCLNRYGVARGALFVFGVPLPPLSEGGVRLLFRQQRSTEIVQCLLAGGLTMLQPFLGCRSRREPVLRQRAPGLLGSTLGDRAGERGRVGAGSEPEEGKFSIRAGGERSRGRGRGTFPDRPTSKFRFTSSSRPTSSARR